MLSSRGHLAISTISNCMVTLSLVSFIPHEGHTSFSMVNNIESNPV